MKRLKNQCDKNIVMTNQTYKQSEKGLPDKNFNVKDRIVPITTPTATTLKSKVTAMAETRTPKQIKKPNVINNLESGKKLKLISFKRQDEISAINDKDDFSGLINPKCSRRTIEMRREKLKRLTSLEAVKTENNSPQKIVSSARPSFIKNHPTANFKGDTSFELTNYVKKVTERHVEASRQKFLAKNANILHKNSIESIIGKNDESSMQPDSPINNSNTVQIDVPINDNLEQETLITDLAETRSHEDSEQQRTKEAEVLVIREPYKPQLRSIGSFSRMSAGQRSGSHLQEYVPLILY